MVIGLNQEEWEAVKNLLAASIAADHYLKHIGKESEKFFDRQSIIVDLGVAINTMQLQLKSVLEL